MSITAVQKATSRREQLEAVASGRRRELMELEESLGAAVALEMWTQTMERSGKTNTGRARAEPQEQQTYQRALRAWRSSDDVLSEHELEQAAENVAAGALSCSTRERDASMAVHLRWTLDAEIIEESAPGWRSRESMSVKAQLQARIETKRGEAVYVTVGQLGAVVDSAGGVQRQDAELSIEGRRWLEEQLLLDEAEVKVLDETEPDVELPAEDIDMDGLSL